MKKRLAAAEGRPAAGRSKVQIVHAHLLDHLHGGDGLRRSRKQLAVYTVGARKRAARSGNERGNALADSIRFFIELIRAESAHRFD